MIRTIRAEFRKVFSIRSTYVILGLIVVLLILFGFYVGGWHSEKSDLANPFRLFQVAQQSISFVVIFPALIGVLLFTHDFRYNTLAYSLTLSNSRTKVLLAKIIVVSVLSIVTAAVVGGLAPLLAKWGISAHHLKLVHQHFSVGALAWRGLVYGWGYAMMGLLFAALIRNQIGAIVTLFIVPDTVEGLLSIWLKSNTVYLPFSALHTVLGTGVSVKSTKLTPVHALYVFLGYLIIGWAVSWYLFIHRDAS